jgi:hypothetical protein
MNGVSSLTHEMRCAHEPVRQVNQAESRKHQYVMEEIVEIVPH